jgi:sulfopyruvate decarboxylase subunit alpha
LQHDPDRAPRQSSRYGVRIVEPILDDMGIAHHLVSVDADVALIKPAIDKAYAESHPVAFLIGRGPS